MRALFFNAGHRVIRMTFGTIHCWQLTRIGRLVHKRERRHADPIAR